MREMVSKPVGRAGKRIIRSLPGEAPRLEHADYEGSFRHVTSVEGDTIRTEAGTGHERGPWFEGGTANMAKRPHVSTLAEEFKGEAETRVAQAFSKPTGA